MSLEKNTVLMPHSSSSAKPCLSYIFDTLCHPNVKEPFRLKQGTNENLFGNASSPLVSKEEKTRWTLLTDIMICTLFSSTLKQLVHYSCHHIYISFFRSFPSCWSYSKRYISQKPKHFPFFILLLFYLKIIYEDYFYLFFTHRLIQTEIS